MKLTFGLLLAIGLQSPVAAADGKAYVQGLYAHTLGFAHVEFYDAYLFVSEPPKSLDQVRAVVRPLCKDFPKLDTYTVRIFTDSKWARPQDFDWTLGPRNNDLRGELVEKYVAEIRPGGKITIYPYRESAQAGELGRDWCKQ